MKKYIFICFVILPFIAFCQINNPRPQNPTEIAPQLDPSQEAVTGQTGQIPDSQPTPPTDPESKGVSDNILSGLVGYNFSSGRNSLKNLTPIVNYGWVKEFSKDFGRIKFEVNPYAAGQIEVNDSANYMPALMLPGIVGIDGKFHLEFDAGESQFTIIPALGLKLIDNFGDSSNTLAQHNFRLAVGYKFQDLFVISTQLTFAWHNLTSESENNFENIFGKEETNLSYINISIQTKLNKESNSSADTSPATYLYAEWRAVLNHSVYAEYDNKKILTIGFRQDIGFNHIAPGDRKDD